MTAAQRFKARMADAIERICVLEETLETVQAERDEALSRLAEFAESNGHLQPKP